MGTLKSSSISSLLRNDPNSQISASYRWWAKAPITTHGWSVKACCKEKSKDLPTTAHWAELFNSNSKVTLNPYKLQRSLLG